MKRIIAAFAAVVASVLALVPLCTAAAENRGYTALGDSIAYGYGLSDVASQCFTNRLADSLKLPFVNYAKNGMTSGGLYELLSGNEQVRTDIGNSAVITVTIGSNDLLGKLNYIWSGAVAINGGILDENAYALLEAALTADSATASFNEGLESYRANLPLIYNAIRSANPDAQIVMTSFYNPYYGVMLGNFDFSALCDRYISAMNDILTAGQAEMDYKIADCYSPFNAVGITNADIASGNVDPHPTPSGHSAIHDAVLAQIDRSAISAMKPLSESAQSEAGQNESEEPDDSAEAQTSEETEQLHTMPLIEKQPVGKYLLMGVAVVTFGVTAAVVSSKRKKK